MADIGPLVWVHRKNRIWPTTFRGLSRLQLQPDVRMDLHRFESRKQISASDYVIEILPPAIYFIVTALAVGKR